MSALEEHLNRQADKSRDFFWNRLRWGLVAEYLPDGETCELVDVGAGPGFLGDFLRERRPAIAYRYVEPIEALESDLEARFGAVANLRQSDSYGAARYVTLLDVLEHQKDDRVFLDELAAKMAPGATLLLTVPALPSLWSEWDLALGHYRRYTKATMESCIAELPLEAEELGYLFPELLPLGWLRRMRRPAGGGEEPASTSAAEFPDLAPALNRGLYRLGRVSMRGRRHWPAGTSLFARLRRSS